jgi:hypothetical protein
MKLCPCGCGPFSPTRSDQKWATAACRTRGYRVRCAQRAARRHKGVTRPVSHPRYALIQRRGASIEVLGYSLGRSKRAVERAFGMTDRDDLAAIAERYLPAVV